MTENGWRILIVDDEESIRRNLQVFLEDEGFSVIAATTGEQGLTMLSPDIVHGAVVDIRLPGMDGNRFIEMAHDCRSDLVFVIYSGSVDYKLPASLQRLGICEEHIFRKPLNDMSALSSTLRNLLQSKSGGEHGG